MKDRNLIKALVVQFVLLVSFAELALGQNDGRTGKLEVIVLNSRGETTASEVELTIDGGTSGPIRRVVVRTGSDILLPWGQYRVSGYAGRYGVASERLVRVYESASQLVIALRPRPMDDDDPWLVRGRVEPAPGPGEIVVARMVGLYVNASAEAVVDRDGTFRLSVWEISPYKLWILRGGKRVAEVDVEVEFLPKVLPPLQIQIP